MASGTPELALAPDELAFYFRSSSGVEAGELGLFLQRAATVARRQGADLIVTATLPGSLAVKLRALKRSLRKEFNETPVKTTAAGAVLVGAVAGAIAAAMSPDSGATPLGKAGAEITEKCHIQQIEVITIQETIVVMDPERARRIREIERRQRRRLPELPPQEVQQLIGHAQAGSLSGAIMDVAGELHFRPDGYRYLVPIDMMRSDAAEEIYPNMHFRVRAELKTLRGQPDMIIIHSATRV